MHLKMIQLLLLLICIIAYRVSAQPDYVVLVKGDTLYGTVKFVNYSIDQQVQITDVNGTKTVYGKLEIKAFKQGTDIYHTIRTDNSYSIMKLQKKGYLSLYAFQPENQKTWDGQYLYKPDGSGLEIFNLQFKKRIKSFLLDCNDVVTAIEAGELGRHDLDEIIDQYNACIADRTITAKSQAVIANKLDELEKGIRMLNDSVNKIMALEAITELKLKVERNEKNSGLFSQEPARLPFRLPGAYRTCDIRPSGDAGLNL
ncbi:hypothetical protein QQ054_33650 [Oscillatoria amoena NRMC-F 0135]|nr:hypothetical protein [Oscillatoria amoena NRMC-F 0135]